MNFVLSRCFLLAERRELFQRLLQSREIVVANESCLKAVLVPIGDVIYFSSVLLKSPTSCL